MGAIGVAVFLNGLAVPGLSEVLLPVGGVAVVHGRISLMSLLIVAMAGQLLGLTAAYLIARYGGHRLVERYGKYVFVSSRELKAAEKVFDKYGPWFVIVGSFIPGIQGFVGYVAGLVEMNYARFLVSALLGKLVWIGGLIYLGSVLGDHVDVIDRGMKQIGVIVLAAVVGLAIWYVYRHKQGLRHKGAKVED